MQPPRPEHDELIVLAKFTEIDRVREARALDRLAALTADTDPWTAASRLFGGSE